MGVRRDNNQGQTDFRKRLIAITYYTSIGKSQKETAYLVGISQKTLCKIKKDYPTHFEKIEAIKDGSTPNIFKMDDSLNTFIPYCKIHIPDLYKLIKDTGAETAFKNHLKLI